VLGHRVDEERYMLRLSENEYERLRPIFGGLRYNLVVDSVIEGNTPAWVIVDTVERPQTALMWNRQDALLLAGYPQKTKVKAALGVQIAEYIIPDAQRRCIPQLSLHYSPSAWEGQIGTILQGRRFERAYRRFYRWGSLKVAWRQRVPSGYELRRIDRELLADAGLTNVEQVVGWVRSFWRSEREFVEKGFGYCLLGEGEVMSWCLSVYRSGRAFELGLATVPTSRNRGFATLTAAACVAHCVERGYTPHWHCWEDNLASIAVADKVGFEQPERYSVYRFGV
jgi:RimJ/RimL family protein N-acetyltransferase